MNAANELTHAVSELARVSGHSWTRFMEAYKRYADAQKDVCVQSPVSELQVAQGRARQAGELFSLFERAVPTVDRIERRK